MVLLSCSFSLIILNTTFCYVMNTLSILLLYSFCSQLYIYSYIDQMFSSCLHTAISSQINPGLKYSLLDFFLKVVSGRNIVFSRNISSNFFGAETSLAMSGSLANLNPHSFFKSFLGFKTFRTIWLASAFVNPWEQQFYNG